jgi:hypothetical protein
MGKASSNKKVSRAARTGGGRTSRGRTPWAWYSSMALVVVLGMFGVVQSRNHRAEQLSAGTKIAPRLASQSHPADHWHVAYGFYLCDNFAAPLPDDAVKGGIHTHADGLIHVEPETPDDTGPHATTGRFLKLAGVTVTEDEIKIPGQKTFKNGAKCGDKDGEVQIYVDGKRREGDPTKILLKDQEHIVFAFVPKGTTTVPEPPSVPNLATATQAQEPGATTATSEVSGDTTGSTAAPGSTPSTAPATTPSTAPASTPSTAPPGTTATTATP